MKRSLRLAAALLALGLGVLALSSRPALAEDEEEGLDEVSREVKAQMEKIIRLMRENEEALLEISTGKRAEPKPVDVTPPALPPGEGANGEGSEGAAGATPPPEGQTGSPPPAGGEAARKLEELIRGQRQTSGRIPGELEELVRLIPT